MARRSCCNVVPDFVSIQDEDDPRLSAYRCLKGKQLERDGIFIAEGEKVVRSMVSGGCRIVSCLVSDDGTDRYGPLLALIAGRGAVIYTAANRVIEGIIGFRFHRGIMAVGCCPEKITIADALKMVRRPLFLVALNAINDPQNVGLITRNVAAFGAQALIVDSQTYDPYYRKAVRVSMGTIFGLRVCYEEDLRSALTRLKKEEGVRIVAATPGRLARDIGEADLSGDLCLVLGNEDTGVSRSIMRIADDKVRIPISNSVDSLNVASAGAVCLYRASLCRRRR